MHSLQKEKQVPACGISPQLVCVLDGAGRVTGSSTGMGDLRPGAIDLHELLHPGCSDAACYLAGFWERTVTAMAKGGQSRLRVWDPVLQRHLEIRAQMLLVGATQNPTSSDPFAVVTVEEITDSNANADKLRHASQLPRSRRERAGPQAEMFPSHLRAIVDKATEFTAMADRSGELFYINPAGRKLLGMEADDGLLGVTLASCQSPAARTRFIDEALPTAEREGLWCGDSVLLGRNGCEVRISLTLIAHRNDSGQLEGFSLLARDMSDWLRTEEALRVTRAQLWRLSAQHLTIQETERRRIAVELHDGLGQTLSLVKLSIEEAMSSVGAGAPDKATRVLERLTPQVRSALSELRRMAMNLRPSTLDDLGIVATLSWYFREFEAACPSIELERDVSVKEADVPDSLKISIFRIVQEATSNALKHARADRIRVGLGCAGGALELCIEDNGKGFEPECAADRRDFNQGLGLQSMKERAELSGALYELQSTPGKGTRISVRWPSQELSERERPVISLLHPSARGTAGSDDRRLTENYSACLACLRSFGGK